MYFVKGLSIMAKNKAVPQVEKDTRTPEQIEIDELKAENARLKKQKGKSSKKHQLPDWITKLEVNPDTGDFEIHGTLAGMELGRKAKKIQWLETGSDSPHIGSNGFGFKLEPWIAL
jgi:hypothetical protein